MRKRQLTHTRTCVYNVNYHFVWSVNYRHPLLTPKIESRLKEICDEIATDKEFIVHKLEVGECDHVHVFASAHPKVSNRRKKAVHRLARMHEKIANKRKDTAHKVSKKLVDQHDILVFEDLHIQKMVKDYRYAKSITDSAWRQLIDFTTYKAENAGKDVRLVNPYNTTQRCSSCGEIVKKTIKDRIHDCSFCGYVEDRDINAAINILQLGLKQTA